MPNVVIDLEPFLPYIIAVAAFLVLLAMGDLADVGQTILGCALKWKENLALYDHPRLRIARTRVFFCMIPATLLLVAYFGFSPLVLCAYCLVRIILKWIFNGFQSSKREYYATAQIPLTYFVIGSVLVYLLFGVCRVIDADPALEQKLFIWTIVVLYAFCLLRQFQVFMHKRGFFAAFLYLCTLELLPTGLLVAYYFV